MEFYSANAFGMCVVCTNGMKKGRLDGNYSVEVVVVDINETKKCTLEVGDDD